MSAEPEVTAASAAEPAWYAKIFEYVKNRNRIGPGKVELPECDFFIVGPRRTLRVLLPTPKGAGYYEPSAAERPETIDENFVSRWATRPHPSGNCRCSFRQSKNRFSTSEDRAISAELNRIRTSLSEAERMGEDIEVVERRISVNLDGLSAGDGPVVVGDPRSQVDEKLAEIANVGPPLPSKRDDDVAIKNKIVKDLEKYIEVLLQEVLSDTMKFFSDAGDTLRRSRAALNTGKDCGSVCFDPQHLDACRSSPNESDASRTRQDDIHEAADGRTFGDGPRNSFDISFAFHEQEARAREEDARYQNGGYVNRGFNGSANDPDSLDFDLRKPVSAEMTIDNLDCVDSGINSVETIEFQNYEEPSLEQSLMEIIDAKFGRAPSKDSWKDSGTMDDSGEGKTISGSSPIVEITEIERNADEDKPLCNGKAETVLAGKLDGEREFKIEDSTEPLKSYSRLHKLDEPSEELNDISDQPNFDKLRLELLETGSDEKRTSAVTSLREKIVRKFGCGNRDVEDDEEIEKTTDEDAPPSPVELRVKSEKIWHDIREPAVKEREENPTDFVKIRRSKKPTIVFLHGFGSSAEIFEHQLEYFSNLGYPCVAPEMLGHGMSSAPDRARDYHFDKLLKDLEVILQHYAFGTGRKCVLVAHNYG